MTVALFITLLTFFATITSLLTEGIKKFLDNMNFTYSSNILVLVLSLIIGIGGAAIFYYIMAIPFTGINVIAMILMGPANWLGAMLGYDKVIQTIEQIKIAGTK